MSDLVALDAETEILAALIIHGREALAIVREQLDSPAAFSPQHREAAEACYAIVSDGDPILPASLRERALALGHLGLAERASDWLGEVMESALGTIANLPVHARIVADLARRRELVAAAEELRRTASDRTLSLPETIGQLMDRVTAQTAFSREDPRRDFMIEAIEDLEQRARLGGALPGVTSRLDGLDWYTDGWERGRLVVCAARPGCGKTAFGVWASQVAVEEDAAVLFVTAEQPTKQLQRRRIAITTGLDLREAGRSSDSWQRVVGKVSSAASALRAQPMVFNQTAQTIRQVRFAVQREVALERPPRIVVVDYLTKLKAEGRHDRHDLAIGSITGGLARLAMELDITVLLLAQLNRDSVKDGKVRRPTVADLRDSGIIEQDADQILLLWPGAPAEDESTFARPRSVTRLEILVEKNRHGPIGHTAVEWDKATGRFRDESRWERPAQSAA